MTEGICRLTCKKGRFVKSHIIPAALTRPEREGANLVQYGQGTRPIKRWSSWYDRSLVIEEGESVLARYDDWGIATLSKHKLLWSSWGPMLSLGTGDFRPIPATPWGVRSISGCDTKRLRLFFLSVLWRAAATRLPEFAEVRLPDDELEKLRSMVLEGNPEPLWFYPISLTQISTRGIAHNHAALALTKFVPAPSAPEEVPFFRFYFDGLIAHIQRPGKRDAIVAELGPLIVGNEDTITVSTVTFEGSSQRTNLLHTVSEAYRDWPQHMDALVDLSRIFGRGRMEKGNHSP